MVTSLDRIRVGPLDSRNLRGSAGTVVTGLRRGPSARVSTRERPSRGAALPRTFLRSCGV
jgi:hypothetical protein